jgi:hypothetical protein
MWKWAIAVLATVPAWLLFRENVFRPAQEDYSLYDSICTAARHCEREVLDGGVRADIVIRQLERMQCRLQTAMVAHLGVQEESDSEHTTGDRRDR